MENQKNSLNHEAIARKAYELYLARNGKCGNATEDWLNAESALKTPSDAKPSVEVKASPDGRKRTILSKKNDQLANKTFS
jgi:hypothetical protein